MRRSARAAARRSEPLPAMAGDAARGAPGPAAPCERSPPDRADPAGDAEAPCRRTRRCSAPESPCAEGVQRCARTFAVLRRRPRQRPQPDLEHRPDRDAGTREPAAAGDGHHRTRLPTAHESRGAHAREDFPARDDQNWLQHSLCWVDAAGSARIDYRPVHLNTLTRRRRSRAAEGEHLLRYDAWPNSACRRTRASTAGRQAPTRRRPGAQRVRTFRIYRFDPDSGENPRIDTLRAGHGELRADGPGRAAQDQERDRSDAVVPPLLPRGHLRFVRDEHRRREHAGLHARLRRPRERATCASIRCRTCRWSRTWSPDLTQFYAQYAAVKPWLQTRTPAPPDRERLQSQGGAGEDRPAIRLHPVRLLLDLLPELLVELRPLPRARGAAGGLPLDHRQPRRGHRRAARCAGGSVPAVSLPHHHELHRGLPEGPQPGARHRRHQADDARAAALSRAPRPGTAGWHCRRGMKELDLLLLRWLDRRCAGSEQRRKSALRPVSRVAGSGARRLPAGA